MALYAFDGTWNNSSLPESKRNTNEDTHVHRFRQIYEANGAKAEYVDGVGSRFGMIGRLVGGLTGAGADERIKELFTLLAKNFKKGDTVIDIVGYSRGAAIARMFVHRIEREYQQLETGGKRLQDPPAVRFLGLFDTVASFGVPWSEDEGEFLPDIPEFVEHTFHAMALDETRETFGIERCYGNRAKITEVWFRGGHGDIGGNSTILEKGKEVGNLKRSHISLNWMLSKARACGLPVGPLSEGDHGTNLEAPVTAKDEKVAIGKVGTLSRRIHLGDLVHHTLEQTELTRGLDRRSLRRISVTTRIEDKEMENQAEPLFWIPPTCQSREADNLRVETDIPSLVELSSRRYPFDLPPARTWRSWLKDQMGLEVGQPGFDGDRLKEFWSPTAADRALAWEIYVELETRIATRELRDHEGNDKTALTSVYSLFGIARECMRSHGVAAANSGALVTAFLNGRIRGFTAKWHQVSLDQGWVEGPQASPCLPFRAELRDLQVELRKLASALSLVAGAKL